MKFTDQQIIAAMKGTGGILSQVLANLSKLVENDETKTMSRQALQQRIDGTEAIRVAREAEQQVIDDLAETQIAKHLQKGERWAVDLWAKYKGRLRGYKTASDVTSAEKALEGGTTVVLEGEQAKDLAKDWQEFLKSKTKE